MWKYFAVASTLHSTLSHHRRSIINTRRSNCNEPFDAAIQFPNKNKQKGRPKVRASQLKMIPMIVKIIKLRKI